MIFKNPKTILEKLLLFPPVTFLDRLGAVLAT